MTEKLEALKAQGVVFERAACPMGCGDGEVVVLDGRDRVTQLPGTFTVVACRGCGLRRTSPRPVPSSMGIFYPDSYAPYHPEGQGTPTKGGASFVGRVISALGLRSHALPPVKPGRMLEVGCASGAFLTAMQKLGWSVQGIEYSDAAAAVARSKGLDVQTSSIEGAGAPAAAVDLIVGWMVLEHLHEPRRALEKMRGWIADDGWLVLSVPDASALEARVFGDAWYALQIPTHLFHYTPKTLGRLLSDSGWAVERVRRQPNAMNLLNSMVAVCEDRRMERCARIARAVAAKPQFAILRRMLGIGLGIIGQSGRMEVWARPSLVRP